MNQSRVALSLEKGPLKNLRLIQSTKNLVLAKNR